MIVFKGKYIGSNLQSGVSNPDFLGIARAYDFEAFNFINNTELEENIDSVLRQKGPTFCEIKMVENQLLIPRVQSSKDADGKIISNSLENMFPYLSKEEMKEIMS